MPTPTSYYELYDKYEILRARALMLLLSDEVSSLKGTNAAPLFDLVGDMTEEELGAALGKDRQSL